MTYDPKELLRVALDREPRLCVFGIDCAQGEAWGNKSHFEAIAASAEWIALCGSRKTMNPKRGSYGYKHAVERFNRKRGTPIYVPNGCFIAAALGMGLPFRRLGHGPNTAHPISEKGIRSIEVAP